MSELDLYKFLNTNRVEIHIYFNGMEVMDMTNFGIEPDVIDTSMGKKYLKMGRVVILESKFYDNSNK